MDTTAPPTTQQDSTQLRASQKSFWGWLLVWVGLIALLVMVAFGLRRAQAGPLVIGEPVHDFTLTTFEGDKIRLADLKGKVVVVNIWASWCKPCEQEAADLETAWRRYEPRGDVVFLGIDYVDTEPEAMAYLKKFDITYPNGPDLGQEIYEIFHATGVPETFVIDQNGVLTFAKYGPFTHLDQILAAIDPLLD